MQQNLVQHSGPAAAPPPPPVFLQQLQAPDAIPISGANGFQSQQAIHFDASVDAQQQQRQQGGARQDTPYPNYTTPPRGRRSVGVMSCHNVFLPVLCSRICIIDSIVIICVACFF